MRLSFKKQTLVLLGLIFTLLLTACGGKGGDASSKKAASEKSGASETASQDGSAADASSDQGYPALDESVPSGASAVSKSPAVTTGKPVELSCWVFSQPDFKVDDYKNNEFTKWLQEKTNTKLTFTVGPAGEAKTKLTILLSGRQYPDILFSPGFTPSEQEMYGQLGILKPLNTLIDKHGSETKKFFAAVPDAKKAVTRSSGKIYCLPSYQEDPHSQSFSRLWINKPLLDRVAGGKIPATTQEFYDTMKKFKESGGDVIPYAGSQALYSDPFGFFLNSFVYFDNAKALNVSGGKITPIFNTAAYKQGLQYLNTLYKDGLLLPQTFSQNDKSLSQLLNSTTTTVGAFTAHAPFLYCSEKVYQNYVAVPPLKGPGGVQYSVQYYNTQTDGSVITNMCKNPEAAMKLLDFLYSDEASMRKSCGPMGTAWKMNTDQSLKNAYGNVPTWVTLQKSLKSNSHWALVGNGYQPLKRSGIYVLDLSPEAVEARKNPNYVEPYVQIEKAAMDIYNKYFPPQDLRLPQALVFTEEEATDISDTELSVTNHVNEMRVKFVTGKANFDKDWDTYVGNLKKLGLEELVKTYQTAYNRVK